MLTGANFGCLSRKKPSDEQEMLNIFLTSCASFAGSNPTERTTMSTGILRTIPIIVSSARITNFPFSLSVVAQSETSDTRPRMNCTPSFNNLS